MLHSDINLNYCTIIVTIMLLVVLSLVILVLLVRCTIFKLVALPLRCPIHLS